VPTNRLCQLLSQQSIRKINVSLAFFPRHAPALEENPHNRRAVSCETAHADQERKRSSGVFPHDAIAGRRCRMGWQAGGAGAGVQHQDGAGNAHGKCRINEAGLFCGNIDVVI